MPYLHPLLYSPDPTIEAATRPCGRFDEMLEVFPHRVVAPAGVGWGDGLDLHRDPGPLTLAPDGDGRAELLLDFGTALHAWLELILTLAHRGHVMAVFGESLPEAQGLIPCTEPRPEVLRAVPAGEAVRVRFDEIHAVALGHHAGTPRGFRFVRLVFHDLAGPVTLRRVCAHAFFTFRERRGAFRCADPALQQAWETSLYTARLCARPDAIWDGIKRDRSGWYGDARVTQQALDAVFHDPRQADAMLPLLPVDAWVNGVPGFSFDAIAMLRQRVLAFGADADSARESFARVRGFLDWVARSQTNADGFLIRSEGMSFFADIGFLDWSLMPVGGRFEELSWLQCKYVEGLRHAAETARWLGHPDDAAAWAARADALQAEILGQFWDPAQGFVHTLNHVGRVPKPLKHGASLHYRRTYVEGVRRGPSGASRQANALAVLAGVCTPAMRETIRRRVFDNPAIPPIITAYFTFFESSARAQCGDASGALRDMADYLTGMIAAEDAATVWEIFDPRVRDLSRYYGGFDVTWEWEISLCHGWGSGLVPLLQRHLLGVDPASPGWAAVRLDPAAPPWPCAFQAVVPTPRGEIAVERAEGDDRLRVRLPRDIEIISDVPERAHVERS